MIDLNLLRKDKEAFVKAISRKRCKVDINEIIKLDEERRELLITTESHRRIQNEANQKISGEKDAGKKSALIAEMKTVSNELKELEEKLGEIQESLNGKLLQIPNPPHESAPDGGEDDASEVKKVGEIRNFEFKPKDHSELGEILDIIDTKRGAKVSGSRFYFLKNGAVRLQFALQQYVMNTLLAKGFTPMITPTLVRESAMIGTGFFPADREQIYAVNPTTETNPEGDDLFLTGTSEVPLTMYHADEILEGDFPKRYCGWSTCYRREAGSYGKDTKGIFRVHQFDKFEMFSFCKPEESWAEHDFILSCEEAIIGGLKLPYRVVNIAAGDLGAPAAKKYDCEVWIPTELRYRELTSCSNCTDFQARRAGIRYRADKGTEYIHTLNGTACAMTRMLIAILENYQNEDGSVAIPEVLQPYMGGEKALTPKK
jgi:seryl-tRNA synthetase